MTGGAIQRRHLLEALYALPVAHSLPTRKDKIHLLLRLRIFDSSVLRLNSERSHLSSSYSSE